MATLPVWAQCLAKALKELYIVTRNLKCEKEIKTILFVLCHGLVGYHVSQRHGSPKVSVVVGDINGGWRAL